MAGKDQAQEQFEEMRKAFELEMIDNHFYSPADFRDAGLQSDGSFVEDELNDSVVVWDAAWKASREAALQGDYLDGVNIPRLREALTFLGIASDEDGPMAVNLSEHVNNIIRGVLRHKELLRSVPASSATKG